MPQASPIVPVHESQNFLVGKIFVLNYKKRHKVHNDPFVADDLADARHKGESYCSKWKLTFISIHPFFLDITKSPFMDRTSYGEDDDVMNIPGQPIAS